MNTDKIYAEAIANEYSVKNTSKVMALKKLDKKVKDFPLAVSLVIGVVSALVFGNGNVPVHGRSRRWNGSNIYCRNHSRCSWYNRCFGELSDIQKNPCKSQEHVCRRYYSACKRNQQ